MHKPHELVRNQKMVGGSMNGSLKVVQAIVLLSFVGLFFTSCGGNQSSLASTTTSGTTTVEPTPTASEPTAEEEEASATIPAGYSASDLFVTVPDTIDYLNLTSLQGSYSSRCSFTTASVVNDLTCNFEVNELALYFHGIKFQYNVPANQCKYISTEPFWYYNYEVGVGPSDVQVSVSKDASGTILSSACVVDGSGSYTCTSLTPPVSAADITVDLSDEVKVKCNYDTSDEDGGKNCCFGKYRLRTTVITPEGVTNTDERGKEWGGSMASCIGGSGKSSWEDFSTSGRPVMLIENVPPNTARTKIYKVEAPITTLKGAPYNTPAANYFASGVHTHNGYGAASGVTSTLPYFVDPISDRSGTRLSTANGYYTFGCLDEAFETNYRIRIMVQEWNTVANLQSYISSGVSGTMGADESGTAPSDCPGISGESCNQVLDVDDILSGVGGTYDTSSPLNRTNFFPKNDMD